MCRWKITVEGEDLKQKWANYEFLIIIHYWKLITIKLPHSLCYKTCLQDEIHKMDFIHSALCLQPCVFLLADLLIVIDHFFGALKGLLFDFHLA